MITQDQQGEILIRYYTEKQSIRQIAFDLSLNRRSVSRVIRRRTIHAQRQAGKRDRITDPYLPRIREMLTKTPLVTAIAVFNKLREMGYMGGKTTVTNVVRTNRPGKPRPREAFLRLDFEPGEATQVDWGEFGDVFGDGVKIHCFAMVLCHSRYIYMEFTRGEKFEDFVRCHEHAFSFFGGVTKQCWYDNLASAVTERMGSLIRFNTRFLAYMGHHGIRPHACNVARGNEKGRVENLIKYIRANFWSGREFRDYEDLVQQSVVWRNQIANQREHRSTRRVISLMYESVEKAALMPRNPNVYDTDEVLSRVVPPDFHVLYETNRYSVPWTMVGMAVTLRICESHVRIFYHDRQVAAHDRCYFKNKVFTRDAHQSGLLERKPGQSKEHWQIGAVKNIGPQMEKYIDLLRAGHRSLRSELSRILALSTVYGDRLVHEAVWDLLGRGIIGVESLELTLKRLHHPSEANLKPAPICFDNQKLNRVVPVVDLRRYDALLFGDVSTSASESSDYDDPDKRDGDFGPA